MATTTKKINAFNSLLENIFVTSLDNRKESVFINVDEEVQILKENNEKDIQRIVEAK